MFLYSFSPRTLFLLYNLNDWIGFNCFKYLRPTISACVSPSKKLFFPLIIFSLPHAAFVSGIHGWAQGTLVRPRKIPRIRQRSEHPYRARGMNARSYFRERVFWAHWTAPYLRVIQEEQLIVSQVESGQGGLLAVLGHPLAVCLQDGNDDD